MPVSAEGMASGIPHLGHTWAISMLLQIDLCEDLAFSGPMSSNLTNNVIRRSGPQYYVAIFSLALLYLLLPFPCTSIYLIWYA